MTIDLSYVPPYLTKWCLFEDVIAHLTEDNFEQAKCLFHDLYYSYKDSCYFCLMHFASMNIMNFDLYYKFFSFLPPTKLKFDNSLFS